MSFITCGPIICISCKWRHSTTACSFLGWLLEFCVIATSKVISGWASACDTVRSWRCYRAFPLVNQATSIMTVYLSQSRYPDTELTSPCPILFILSTRLESDKHQFYKSLVSLGWEQNTNYLLFTNLCAILVTELPKWPNR